MNSLPPILTLMLRSVANRKATATLTILAIAFSVALLLGVEKIRTEARSSFANTISGTDLIVGARSGSVQLLLYSVFRIGNATNNISWKSYREIASQPGIAWTIPISLGDSHRGFRVMGTTQDYFKHYAYARTRKLVFAQGRPFADVYDAVLGADVARELNYTTGQNLVVAHGAGTVNILKHEDKPFRVAGILEKTGTPVDRTVHVSLAGIEAMHIDWKAGVPVPGDQLSAADAAAMDLTPKAITAFMVGLESKVRVFALQRKVNDYRKEPLLAILPGVALHELWALMSVAEQSLLVISAFVVVTGLVGMLAMILASLNERRREMAILRSVGARPGHIFALLMGEAAGFATAGCIAGIALLYAVLLIARPIVETKFGLHLSISMLKPYDFAILGIVMLAGFIVGLVPGYRAYRRSLADGMTVRM